MADDQLEIEVSPMALPDRVPIKQSQVKAEFKKGNNLLDYLGVASGIPARPPLKLTDFLGKSAGPDVPGSNHAYAGRVIYDYGTASSQTGSATYKQNGNMVAINSSTNDLHIMFCGHAGGYVFEAVQDMGYGTFSDRPISGSYSQTSDPQMKVSVGANPVPSGNSTVVHYMTCKTSFDASLYPVDFMAYAFVIPAGNVPWAAGTQLTRSYSGVLSTWSNPEISGAKPNSVALAIAADVREVGATQGGPGIGGLNASQGGTSKNNRWKISGGYRWFAVGSNGSGSVALNPSGLTQAWMVIAPKA
jgi:hypothetical protein